MHIFTLFATGCFPSTSYECEFEAHRACDQLNAKAWDYAFTNALGYRYGNKAPWAYKDACQYADTVTKDEEWSVREHEYIPK